MKVWILALVATFVAAASAQCTCKTMKWATCDGTPCQCTLLVGDNVKQPLNCDKLIPKCFLMKAEMYRRSKNLDTRSSGGPVEEAFVDNDGIYDPECESDGKFKSKQCNNTEECWCVNSAGVRRTDKGDKNIKCEELVETYWIQLQLKHEKEVKDEVTATEIRDAFAQAISTRYLIDKAFVTEAEYDRPARFLKVNMKKDKEERGTELGNVAYYMEKDIKKSPLFQQQAKFAPTVRGNTLNMTEILVYYVDAKAPTFTMKNLSGGIIAVIVVVVLIVVAGLLALFFLTRKQKQGRKPQGREMDNL